MLMFISFSVALYSFIKNGGTFICKYLFALTHIHTLMKHKLSQFMPRCSNRESAHTPPFVFAGSAVNSTNPPRTRHQRTGYLFIFAYERSCCCCWQFDSLPLGGLHLTHRLRHHHNTLFNLIILRWHSEVIHFDVRTCVRVCVCANFIIAGADTDTSMSTEAGVIAFQFEIHSRIRYFLISLTQSCRKYVRLLCCCCCCCSCMPEGICKALNNK